MKDTLNVLDVAKICHETNRAYCESLGDFSQAPWADAPAWQKESAVNGVIYHLDTPTAGPESSHESWLQMKEANGWKYGPVKDAEKKEHPCFVPFDDLPQSQQMKDYLFTTIVLTLAGMVRR